MSSTVWTCMFAHLGRLLSVEFDEVSRFLDLQKPSTFLDITLSEVLAGHNLYDPHGVIRVVGRSFHVFDLDEDPGRAFEYAYAERILLACKTWERSRRRSTGSRA